MIIKRLGRGRRADPRGAVSRLRSAGRDHRVSHHGTDERDRGPGAGHRGPRPARRAPVRVRACWVHRPVEGYELAAVAEAVGCSIATAKRDAARVQRHLERTGWGHDRPAGYLPSPSGAPLDQGDVGPGPRRGQVALRVGAPPTKRGAKRLLVRPKGARQTSATTRRLDRTRTSCRGTGMSIIRISLSGTRSDRKRPATGSKVMRVDGAPIPSVTDGMRSWSVSRARPIGVHRRVGRVHGGPRIALGPQRPRLEIGLMKD